METQMNVRVPAALKKKVKQEAARTGKTAEIVITSALEDFFKSWTADERLKFYAGRQPYSRKPA